MTDLDALLSFFLYQNRLKFVFRTNSTEGSRKESSAEHSWSVAMMCWMLIDQVEHELNVNLDRLATVQMALIHDLVEIDAGDVAAWMSTDRKAVTQAEHQAIERIRSKLPNKVGNEVYDLWHQHERREAIESKLVKACDQLCPLIYRVDLQVSYVGTGVNKRKLDEIFLPIVSFSKATLELYNVLSVRIEELQLFDT